MLKFPLWFLSAICMTATASDRVRLVLDSGWILSVSNDGSHLLSEPAKLELPRTSQGILAFRVDYTNNHLFVTPDGPFESRGTHVFELSTLRPIGFMPGVTDIVLPADPKAPWFTAETYTLAKDEGPLESLEELQDLMSAKTVELRDRRDWKKVVAKQSGKPGFDVFARWNCYAGKDREYRSLDPYATYTLSRNLGRAEKRAKTDGEVILVTQGCWPNGDALLAGRDRYDLAPATTKTTLVKLSRSGEQSKFASDATWHLPAQDHSVLVPLGADGRYVAYLDLFGRFMLFDFETMQRTTPSLNGNPRYGQFSADRRDWYIPAISYVFKGSNDWEYVTGSLGSWRETGDTIHRFSLRGAPHAETLRLPPEITEINRREEELKNIRRRDDLSEEEKQALIDELPQLGPLAAKIQHVGILGAIAD